jgi:hypothetical protein
MGAIFGLRCLDIAGLTKIRSRVEAGHCIVKGRYRMSRKKLINISGRHLVDPMESISPVGPLRTASARTLLLPQAAGHSTIALLLMAVLLTPEVIVRTSSAMI